MSTISVASIDIDIPSLLVGVGAGVAGLDMLSVTAIAGFSVLSIGLAAVAFGYLHAKYNQG
ncbi:hypothetical protein [Haloarchaeobius litoreus]|uniref:Uncharacterized protein n=1 Tax=Haloarchaeobius litoreus TaxID=755306 RepID=A0ABD6DLJ2_9EURY|nr:hypothetical protein [Haloarchaeobius litoreus]